MSLLPASGEILSEFPSPRVIPSFFPPPRPYRLGWPCQELKLPPASLSGSIVTLKKYKSCYVERIEKKKIAKLLYS
jgi:hypothetical protein